MELSFYYPYYVVWELTLKCNMNCLHCGSYAGTGRENELTDEETLDLCDQLGRLGTKKVTISGGEPFLRDNWFEIAKRLNKNRIEVYAVTNGYYIKENIDKLKQLNIGQIAISLDGTRHVHNKIRRKPDAHEKVMEGLEALRDAGIERGVITAVSKWNIDDLEGIYKDLKRLEVNNWQLQIVFGGGRMREYKDFIIPPADVKRICEFIVRKRMEDKDLNVFPANDVGYYTTWGPYMRNKPWGGCQAGIWAIGIEANGNIKGCLSILPEIREDGENPFVEGNIRETKLKDIWYDKSKFLFNRQFNNEETMGFCGECEHLQMCRCGCVGIAYYSSGSRYQNEYCLHALAVKEAGGKTKE